jgi:acyltransferase
MQKRIEWVDIVKGLLILTVILGHAIQESLKVRFISFEDNLWRNIIYSFHMPAFMAMSGYVAQGKVFRIWAL